MTELQKHNIDKVKVEKTTQNGSREVEKIKVLADDLDITIFGSRDEDSAKDKTIDLEVIEDE
jgi:hypothetical protein